MRKKFQQSAARLRYKKHFNNKANVEVITCLHASFKAEAQAIAAGKTYRDIKKLLIRNGWEYTGQGKGDHMQYKKQGILEALQIYPDS